MAKLVDYDIIQSLGAGAFATVVKARHIKHGYVCALKILEKNILNGEDDPTWKKFYAECQTLLKIGNGSHPNILRLRQPALDGTRAFVEMDYIDGEDIAHIIEEHRFMSVDEVVNMVHDIGSALAYCHHDIYTYSMDKDIDNIPDNPQNGAKCQLSDEKVAELVKKYRVIHNDIHAGNIMRRSNGSYVLLDFGLAIQDTGVLRSSQRANGAVEYKAPEKWDNPTVETLTTASDIYSFGIVMYELLAGRVPFIFDKSNPNSTEAEYLVQKDHKDAPVPPIFPFRKAAFESANPGMTLDKPDYPAWLEELILKCLQKKPENRFRDGKQLYEFFVAHTRMLYSGADQITKQNEELLAKIERHKEEYQRLKDTKEAEIEKLLKENFDLRKQQSGGTANRTTQSPIDLERENERLQTLVSDLKKEVIDYRKEVESLQSKIKNIENGSANRYSDNNDNEDVRVFTFEEAPERNEVFQPVEIADERKTNAAAGKWKTIAIVAIVACVFAVISFLLLGSGSSSNNSTTTDKPEIEMPISDSSSNNR